jgi:hypothetical protein
MRDLGQGGAASTSEIESTLAGLWLELCDEPVGDRLEEVGTDLVVAVGHSVKDGSKRLAVRVHDADPVVFSP